MFIIYIKVQFLSAWNLSIQKKKIYNANHIKTCSVTFSNNLNVKLLLFFQLRQIDRTPYVVILIR
jgi:hypothetical protein